MSGSGDAAMYITLGRGEIVYSGEIGGEFFLILSGTQMDLVLSEVQKKLPGTGRDFRMRLEWGIFFACFLRIKLIKHFKHCLY